VRSGSRRPRAARSRNGRAALGCRALRGVRAHVFEEARLAARSEHSLQLAERPGRIGHGTEHNAGRWPRRRCRSREARGRLPLRELRPWRRKQMPEQKVNGSSHQQMPANGFVLRRSRREFRRRVPADANAPVDC
jgi:hypothetical protein